MIVQWGQPSRIRQLGTHWLPASPGMIENGHVGHLEVSSPAGRMGEAKENEV